MLLDEGQARSTRSSSPVLSVIRELAEGGMTMLIATHEMSFARDIAVRVCFLDEGVILEQGDPRRSSRRRARRGRSSSCSGSSPPGASVPRLGKPGPEPEDAAVVARAASAKRRAGRPAASRLCACFRSTGRDPRASPRRGRSVRPRAKPSLSASGSVTVEPSASTITVARAPCLGSSRRMARSPLSVADEPGTKEKKRGEVVDRPRAPTGRRVVPAEPPLLRERHRGVHRGARVRVVEEPVGSSELREDVGEDVAALG